MKTPAMFLAGVCGITLNSAFAQTADTIYQNGAILTMVGKDPAYVEALAVKDGKILATGAKDEIFKTKGDATKVIDLAGKTLLPGFLDGHSHYINSLLVANQCKLYPPPSGPGQDVPAIIAELEPVPYSLNFVPPCSVIARTLTRQLASAEFGSFGCLNSRICW